jgi:hypothetical protein
VVRAPIRPANSSRIVAAAPVDDGVMFLDAEVVQAEVVLPAASDNDIMFIQ